MVGFFTLIACMWLYKTHQESVNIYITLKNTQQWTL